MQITSTTLGRAAGLAAVAAGTLFALVQINHPPMEVASVSTTEWVVRNTMKTVMAGLALAGFTGMYLRQVRRTGVLGLVGYVLLSIGYLTLLAITFVAAYIVPALAESAPRYVDDILAVAAGGTAIGDVGLFTAVNQVAGFGYLVGGLLFGIALFRARVLARWAAALLAAGTVATVLLPVLPYAVHRFFALPTALALIGLGISLWRDQRAGSRLSEGPVTVSAPEQVSVR
jgi:hypothetical protein